MPIVRPPNRSLKLQYYVRHITINYYYYYYHHHHLHPRIAIFTHADTRARWYACYKENPFVVQFPYNKKIWDNKTVN